MFIMIDDTIRPSYVNQGREYYNRTMAARYVQMTDSGFRRKIKKFEEENNIVIPTISRGGQQKMLDRRILDQYLKPIFTGSEQQWVGELKQIINQIKSE
jgi:hypothetical protein